MTIQSEFDRIITDVFPQAGNGVVKCSLTAKRRGEYERFFFAGYKSCLTAVMLSSDMPEGEANAQLERMFQELENYTSKPE